MSRAGPSVRPCRLGVKERIQGHCWDAGSSWLKNRRVRVESTIVIYASIQSPDLKNVDQKRRDLCGTAEVLVWFKKFFRVDEAKLALVALGV